MTWLNRYEVDSLVEGIDPAHHPNAAKGAQILQRLMEWTDDHSDGWPYWQKPSKAADLLMQHLHVRYLGAYDKRIDEDMTDAELARVLTPIKAFLTRQSVYGDERARILEVA